MSEIYVSFDEMGNKGQRIRGKGDGRRCA